MSSYPNEYNGGSVTSGGCSYASLSNYNQGYYGRSILAPVPVQNRSLEIIVPSFGAPGYNLSSGDMGEVASCGGYSNISKSYPNFPSNCGSFSSSLCGSGGCN